MRDFDFRRLFQGAAVAATIAIGAATMPAVATAQTPDASVQTQIDDDLDDDGMDWGWIGLLGLAGLLGLRRREPDRTYTDTTTGTRRP